VQTDLTGNIAVRPALTALGKCKANASPTGYLRQTESPGPICVSPCAVRNSGGLGQRRKGREEEDSDGRLDVVAPVCFVNSGTTASH
jgi:hypothetical protein